MKKIVKLITIALAAAMTMTMVSSCDGLGSLLGDGSEDTEYGEYKAGWTEEGNKLIYKQTLDYGIGSYTQILIFEFSGDKCKKATGEFVWPSAILAQAFYEELDADDKANAKISGKKVTIDLTDDYKDLSKSELKEAINATDGWM